MLKLIWNLWVWRKREKSLVKLCTNFFPRESKIFKLKEIIRMLGKKLTSLCKDSLMIIFGTVGEKDKILDFCSKISMSKIKSKKEKKDKLNNPDSLSGKNCIHRRDWLRSINLRNWVNWTICVKVNLIHIWKVNSIWTNI